MLIETLGEPKLAAIAVTTGLQLIGAAALWTMSRRTVAARARKEAGELRAKLEKAEKALQTVYAGCGPRLWIVYTRGTEFEKTPPKPPPPKQKPKQKTGHAARNVAAASIVLLLGVLL